MYIFLFLRIFIWKRPSWFVEAFSFWRKKKKNQQQQQKTPQKQQQINESDFEWSDVFKGIHLDVLVQLYFLWFDLNFCLLFCSFLWILFAKFFKVFICNVPARKWTIFAFVTCECLMVNLLLVSW